MNTNKRNLILRLENITDFSFLSIYVFHVGLNHLNIKN